MEFKKRPKELRVTIAKNNAEAAAKTYSSLIRERKGDNIAVEKTVITGTNITVTPKI